MAIPELISWPVGRSALGRASRGTRTCAWRDAGPVYTGALGTGQTGSRQDVPLRLAGRSNCFTKTIKKNKKKKFVTIRKKKIFVTIACQIKIVYFFLHLSTIDKTDFEVWCCVNDD